MPWKGLWLRDGRGSVRENIRGRKSCLNLGAELFKSPGGEKYKELKNPTRVLKLWKARLETLSAFGSGTAGRETIGWLHWVKIYMILAATLFNRRTVLRLYLCGTYIKNYISGDFRSNESVSRVTNGFHYQSFFLVVTTATTKTNTLHYDDEWYQHQHIWWKRMLGK